MTSVWVAWRACLRGIHGHIISDVEHHDDGGTYANTSHIWKCSEEENAEGAKECLISYSQWLTGYWKLNRCKIALMTESKGRSRETHELSQLFDSDSTMMVAMVKSWFQFWKKLLFQNLVSCFSAYSQHGRLPFKTTAHVREGCVGINATQIQYKAKFRSNLFQKNNNNYRK